MYFISNGLKSKNSQQNVSNLQLVKLNLYDVLCRQNWEQYKYEEKKKFFITFNLFYANIEHFEG